MLYNYTDINTLKSIYINFIVSAHGYTVHKKEIKTRMYTMDQELQRLQRTSDVTRARLARGQTADGWRTLWPPS